jgi:hypothetical protein
MKDEDFTTIETVCPETGVLQNLWKIFVTLNLTFI